MKHFSRKTTLSLDIGIYLLEVWTNPKTKILFYREGVPSGGGDTENKEPTVHAEIDIPDFPDIGNSE